MDSRTSDDPGNQQANTRLEKLKKENEELSDRVSELQQENGLLHERIEQAEEERDAAKHYSEEMKDYDSAFLRLVQVLRELDKYTEYLGQKAEQALKDKDYDQAKQYLEVIHLIDKWYPGKGFSHELRDRVMEVD